MKNRYKVYGKLSSGLRFESACLANDMLDCAKQYWIRDLDPESIVMVDAKTSSIDDSYVEYTNIITT